MISDTHTNMNIANFKDEETYNLYNQIQRELVAFYNSPRGNSDLIKEFLYEILKYIQRLSKL